MLDVTFESKKAVKNDSSFMNKDALNETCRQEKEVAIVFYSDFDDFPPPTPWLPLDWNNKFGEKFEKHREKLCGSRIKAHDFSTLNPQQWLNDIIIDSYLDLISQRSKSISSNSSLPKVFNFNCFFYNNYIRSEEKNENWISVNIFDYDMLLLPINKKNTHWKMVIIDLSAKIIGGFDSSSHDNTIDLEYVRKFMVEQARRQSLEYEDWEIFNDKCPKQMNWYDCGVYACQFAQFISKKQKLKFRQVEMNYFRKRMKYELLTGKLLD